MYIEPTVVNVRTYIAILAIIDVSADHFEATGCPVIQANDLRAAFPAEAAKRGLGIRSHWIASILDELCRYGLFRFYTRSGEKMIAVNATSFRMTTAERESMGIKKNAALYVALNGENVVRWLKPATTTTNTNFDAVMELDRSIVPVGGTQKDFGRLKRDSAHGMAVIRAGHAMWRMIMVPQLQAAIFRVEDLMARTAGETDPFIGISSPTLAICPVCQKRIASGIERNSMQSAVQMSSGAVTSTGYTRDRAIAYLHVACANSVVARKFESRASRIESLGLFGPSDGVAPEVALNRSRA